MIDKFALLDASRGLFQGCARTGVPVWTLDKGVRPFDDVMLFETLTEARAALLTLNRLDPEKLSFTVFPVAVMGLAICDGFISEDDMRSRGFTPYLPVPKPFAPPMPTWAPSN